jgi:hypothetical protein
LYLFGVYLNDIAAVCNHSSIELILERRHTPVRFIQSGRCWWKLHFTAGVAEKEGNNAHG